MSRPRDLESTRDMKTLLNIRHAFQRTRRHAVWSGVSAFVLPVALLVVLTTCSSPTACAMGRVAGQANAANSQRASVPAGLPTHFSFGLMSAPGTSGGMNDMRTRNGTKWDVALPVPLGGCEHRLWLEHLEPAGGCLRDLLHARERDQRLYAGVRLL